MNSWDTIVENLDEQDVLRINKYGLSDDIEREVSALCTEYCRLDTKERGVMRSKLGRKGSVVVLSFVSRMATLAMQRKDVDALDRGLVALDLSNIMKIDFRDAIGYVARLAFAANRCGVELVGRGLAVIPEVSPKLLELLQNPGVPRVTRDGDGNLVFWSPWLKSKHKDITP